MPIFRIKTSRGEFDIERETAPTQKEAERFAEAYARQNPDWVPPAQGDGLAATAGKMVSEGVGTMVGTKLGEYTLGGAKGRMIGGAVGAAAGNLLGQMASDEPVKGGEVAAAAMMGALPGGNTPKGSLLSGAVAKEVGKSALKVAGVGAGAEATRQVLDEGEIDPMRVALAGGIGAVTGGVGEAVINRYITNGYLITPNVMLQRAGQGAIGLGAGAMAYNHEVEAGNSAPLAKAAMVAALTIGGTHYLPKLLTNSDGIRDKLIQKAGGSEAVMGSKAVLLNEEAKAARSAAELESVRLAELAGRITEKLPDPNAAKVAMLGFMDGHQKIDTIPSNDLQLVMQKWAQVRHDYSNRIYKLFGHLDPDLRKTIIDNEDSYLRQTYSAFDPKAQRGVDWAKPADRAALRADLITNGMAEKEADIWIDNLTGNEHLLFGAGWKGGNGPSSSLMSKKGVTPLVAAYLGEVKDPILRMASTLNTQARLINDFTRESQMAKYLKDTGLGFDSNPTGELVRVVEGDVNSKLRRPLQELWVPTEVAAAYKDLVQESLLGEGAVAKTFMAVHGAAKAAKTVGNVLEAQMPQLLGNAALAASAGKLNPVNIFQGLKMHLAERGWMGKGWSVADQLKLTEDLRLATKFGVLKGGADVEELKKFVSSSVLEDKGLPRRAMDFAASIYQTPDSAVRYGIWKSNMKELQSFSSRKFTGMEDLMKEAARVTNEQFPTYEMVNKVYRKASAIGATNAFGAFEMEVLRNTVNQVTYAGRLIREGKQAGDSAMVKAGLGRALSLLSVGAATVGIRNALTRANGVSEEEVQALRDSALQSYDLDKDQVYKISEDGKGFSYANLNYMLPHANLARAITSAISGNTEDAKNVLMQSYIGNDKGPLLTNAIEAISNTYAGTKVPITQPRDNSELALRFMSNTFVPQVISGTAERARKAAIGEVSRVGAAPTYEDVGLRIAGYRQNTSDILKSASARIRVINDELTALQSDYKQKAKSVDEMARSGTNLQAIYETNNAKYLEKQAELRKAYEGLTLLSERGGFDQKDIAKAFSNAGVPGKLLLGSFVGYQVPMSSALAESTREIVEGLMDKSQHNKIPLASLMSEASLGSPITHKALWQAYMGIKQDEAKGSSPISKAFSGLSIENGERADHFRRMDATLRAQGPEGAKKADALKQHLLINGGLTSEVYYQIMSR